MQTAENALKLPALGWVTTTCWSGKTLPPPTGMEALAMACVTAPDAAPAGLGRGVAGPAAGEGDGTHGTDRTEGAGRQHRAPAGSGFEGAVLVVVGHGGAFRSGLPAGHGRTW